jgi:rSAM-associated Gly-rich repeat protein
MDNVSSEARVQLKQKLLNLLKAAPAAGIVLASATLSVSSAEASFTRAEPRLSIEQRVANVRNHSADPNHQTILPGTGTESSETLLAWGNWHNWHNGWHNGWSNWHNWHNW